MRTVIVGDVHGCCLELEALLDKIHFGSGDRLVFVGDLIARGPDSLGVLDVARRTGAIVVRGNHEQKVLDWKHGHDRFLRGEGPEVDIGKQHKDVALALRPVDWVILERTPIWVDLPEHNLRVVHAGFDPSRPVEAQDPNTLMRIRTVGAAPAAAPGEAQEHVLWGARYAGPVQVVFGHNALAGLQLHPFATGLDSGCVYGKRLTAMVLSEGQRVPGDVTARRKVLVSEDAKQVWYEPRAPDDDPRRRGIGAGSD